MRATCDPVGRRNLGSQTTTNPDEKRDRRRSQEHDVSQAEAESIFFNQPLLIVEDAGHSQVEQRLHALGKTHGHRLLHLTFTLRENDTLIRVISAGPMHRVAGITA